VLPRRLWKRTLETQQAALYGHFARIFPPTDTQRVLDLGVNASIAERESYVFESRYPFLERVVSAGLESGDRFARLFPEARYVQIHRDEPLPFPDRSFDLVFCNAVIEHVGDRRAQAAFLAEALRVTDAVFLTTPNRWYPVELHTLVPLLHYLPAPAYRRAYRAMGFDFFAREENLNLLDRASLSSMVPAGFEHRIERHSFLGLPSNLLLVARRIEP
jgi:SAM-dependent methyltransferase